MTKRFTYSEKTELVNIETNIHLSQIKIHELALAISHNNLTKYYGQELKKLNIY